MHVQPWPCAWLLSYGLTHGTYGLSYGLSYGTYGLSYGWCYGLTYGFGRGAGACSSMVVLRVRSVRACGGAERQRCVRGARGWCPRAERAVEGVGCECSGGAPTMRCLRRQRALHPWWRALASAHAMRVRVRLRVCVCAGRGQAAAAPKATAPAAGRLSARVCAWAASVVQQPPQPSVAHTRPPAAYATTPTTTTPTPTTTHYCSSPLPTTTTLPPRCHFEPTPA